LRGKRAEARGKQTPRLAGTPRRLRAGGDGKKVGTSQTQHPGV